MNKFLLDLESASVPAGLSKQPFPRQVADAVRGTYLRIGRVVTVYDPQDARSINKDFYEYDVEIYDDSPIASVSTYQLYRCRMMCSFGGVADFSKWTPRPVQTTNRLDIGEESLVIVLCINGRGARGLIIGGFQNPKAEKDDQADGHSAVWQFNGIRAQVDKDGQFKLSFKGATDANNELLATADANASGAAFQITKDGSIKLFTSGDSQFIDFNHTNKTVALTSEKETALTCKSGLIKTSSTGVHLGMATDDMVKGTTYRTQEAVMHASMQAAVDALGKSLGAVSAGLDAACTAAGPNPLTAALVPGLTAAARALNAAQGALTSLATAISTFEKQASEYLSTKNKLD